VRNRSRFEQSEASGIVLARGVGPRPGHGELHSRFLVPDLSQRRYVVVCAGYRGCCVAPSLEGDGDGSENRQDTNRPDSRISTA
jgi:hypothetical protein